ncbi:hypothetical protein [Rhizobium sp. R693]|uniref:hypothetical protein n=1 Tax=Rhizobium sp. R693 TaxID=1764276 RepID=UPI001131CDE2|nr:hypothetical protein [Rhizobium sp. R693]
MRQESDTSDSSRDRLSVQIADIGRCRICNSGTIAIPGARGKAPPILSLDLERLAAAIVNEAERLNQGANISAFIAYVRGRSTPKNSKHLAEQVDNPNEHSVICRGEIRFVDR